MAARSNFPRVSWQGWRRPHGGNPYSARGYFDRPVHKLRRLPVHLEPADPGELDPPGVKSVDESAVDTVDLGSA